ncbi:MAG: hypothetical protein RL215_3130, partial [Planctomycetota bacterium]
MNSNPRALSSLDAERWWHAHGPADPFDITAVHPDLQRLVLGDLQNNSPLPVSSALNALLQNLSYHFPNLTHLHLWGLTNLRELTGLPSTLECLDLRNCTDLNHLELTSQHSRLQTLDLGNCSQLQSLPALDWKQLRRVWLSDCRSLTSFAPLRTALPSLEHLELHGCTFSEPGPELRGIPGENVAAKVRQHYVALEQQGTDILAECKVIVLGNGGVGKTELVRALKGLPFDARQPSTHGIRLWDWDGSTAGHAPVLFPELPNAPLQLNIWDFGGQDLYHNTHRLFLEAQAIFLIVERFHPKDQPLRAEHPDDIARPLDYWLDLVHNLRRQPRVIVVRSAVDKDHELPEPAPHELGHRVRPQYRNLPFFTVSSCERTASRSNWPELRSQLLQYVREELGDSHSIQLPKGRVAVRRELQNAQSTESSASLRIREDRRLLRHRQFQELAHDCFTSLKIPAPDDTEIRWQLDFFHNRGVVYAPPAWIERAVSPKAYPVVVDQRWLIEGIYQLLRGGSERLATTRGRVSRKFLWQTWDQLEQHGQAELHYDEEARNAMLYCMESCGLLIPTHDDHQQWILPEKLPDRDAVFEFHSDDRRVQLRNQTQVQTFRIKHPSLGLGFGCQLVQWIVQTFGSKVPLFRFGALVEVRVADPVGGRSRQILVELQWAKDNQDKFAGDLYAQVPSDCPEVLDVLDEISERLLQKSLLPAGAKFEPLKTPAQTPPPRSFPPNVFPKLSEAVSPVIQIGKVGISMKGHPDPSSPLELWPRIIQKMLEESSGGKFEVVCYRRDQERHSTQQLYEDLKACDLLIAVLSHDYLHSHYCMAELLQSARQWSIAEDTVREQPGFLGNPQEWEPHIQFVLLEDADWICTDQQRIQAWKQQWYEDALDYENKLNRKHGSKQKALELGPDENVYDHWMRFAAADSGNSEQLRNALKHNTDRQSAPPLPKTQLSPAELDSWARQQLSDLNVINKLISRIQKLLGNLQPSDQLKRTVHAAVRKFQRGHTLEACRIVDACIPLT